MLKQACHDTAAQLCIKGRSQKGDMDHLCADDFDEKPSATFYYFAELLLENYDGTALLPLDTNRISKMVQTPTTDLSNKVVDMALTDSGNKVVDTAVDLYKHGRLMLSDKFCDDYERNEDILKFTYGQVWKLLESYTETIYGGALRLEALQTYNDLQIWNLLKYCENFNAEMHRFANTQYAYNDARTTHKLAPHATDCFYREIIQMCTMVNITHFYSKVMYPVFEAVTARYATLVAENAAKEKKEQQYKMYMQRKDEQIAQGSEDMAKLTQQLHTASRNLADKEKQAARNKKNEEKTAAIKRNIADLNIKNAQNGVETWETQAKELMASLVKQSTAAVVTAQTAFKDAMIARKLDMERINNEQWSSDNVDNWNNALNKFKNMSVPTGARRSGFIPGTNTPVAQEIYLFPRPQDMPELYNKVAKSLMQNIGLWAAMAGPVGFRDHIAENA